MKTYRFGVGLCGGWSSGSIKIKAENEDVAYEQAMDYVANKLAKAFPELDIEYNVECDNPDEEDFD